MVTQPNSFDLLDTEFFSLKKLIPSGNIQGMDARRIKQADNITPVFTKGEVGGKKIGDQGTAPKKVFYLEGQNSKTFAGSPTEWITLIPTTYNADTLGIRPDLIKRPISSWKELLNPEFKGKASILNIPSIGIMDAAMVIEATGDYTYPDKGNMTKAEIDRTIKVLIEAKRAGQFPCLLAGLQRVREPDGVGRDRDPVDVVPRRHQGPQPGRRLHLPAAQGGLPRLGHRLRPAKTLTGRKLDAAYDFINWFLSAWAGAYLNRQGYYSAVLETAKAHMEPYEWAYWMEASPPRRTSRAGRQRAGEGRRHPRRRLLRDPHGQRRLLERRDGREHLHGPQVERVHRRVSRGATQPSPSQRGRVRRLTSVEP